MRTVITRERQLQQKVITRGIFGAALVAAVSLSACGGSDYKVGDQATPVAPAPVPTVSIGGVAAVGKPLAGATITARCAGTTPFPTVTTTPAGSWSVTVPQAALPCALQASGGTVGAAANVQNLYSYASAAGVVNFTPLTDLSIALATRGSTSAWFTSFDPTKAQPFEAALTAVTPKMLGALNSAGLAVPSGSFDPRTSSFAAAAGDTYDALLDVFARALVNNGTTYTAFLNAMVAIINGGGALSFPSPTPPVAVPPPVVVPPPQPVPQPVPIPGPSFGKATSYGYTGIYKPLAGNHDADVVSCVKDAPVDPNTFNINFSQGTAIPNLTLSIDPEGAITFGDVIDTNSAGSLLIFTQQVPAVAQVSYSSALTALALYTNSDGTGDYVVRSAKAGNKVTGCRLKPGFVASLRAVDVTARLKLILGNGLKAVCAGKNIQFGTDGTFAVNGSQPMKFDLGKEATGTFFPSGATYREQRFVDESGKSATNGFFIALFLPASLPDGTLEIDVDALTISSVTLGATACTPGS